MPGVAEIEQLCVLRAQADDELYEKAHRRFGIELEHNGVQSP